jgi:hypothetical protein
MFSLAQPLTGISVIQITRLACAIDSQQTRISPPDSRELFAYSLPTLQIFRGYIIGKIKISSKKEVLSNILLLPEI